MAALPDGPRIAHLALFDSTLEMRLAALCLAALAAADALSAPAAGTKAKRVFVPIADGTEEIEVVTVVDVLRRAGAEVVLASVEDDDRTAVTCSRGVKIEADCHVKAVTGRQAWSRSLAPHARGPDKLTSLTAITARAAMQQAGTS